MSEVEEGGLVSTRYVHWLAGSESLKWETERTSASNALHPGIDIEVITEHEGCEYGFGSLGVLRRATPVALLRPASSRGVRGSDIRTFKLA